MSAAPPLTERQVVGWSNAIKRLRECGAGIPENINRWAVTYADEVRPGRGHFINAQYTDGEIYAQILMDAYGYPSASYATLEWVHADSDEECACAPCGRQRVEDGAA